MSWDFTVKVADIAIVVATLLGPVFAIQIQKYLDRGREATQRRTWVFRTLMSTRSMALSNEHVQALNVVPIEFYGKQKITTAWKAYLEHLGAQQVDQTAWGVRRVDLFMELLRRMAAELGYDFDVVQLKDEFYSPKGHADRQSEDEQIRKGILSVMTGQSPIHVQVRGPE